MFYYYGRKKRIVKFYPEPENDIIIEPFAGSAAYAMEYYDRNVILYEINNKIYSVWKFLKEASPNDILNLPLINKGQSLNNKEFDYLTDPEKWVIGLFLNPGSSVPKKSPGNFCYWDDSRRAILSKDVIKIKHWEIKNESYENAPDIKATWFVDPPYQNAGKYYVNSKVDYKYLGDWCKNRRGQVIVCENEGADWLDFEPLTSLKGQKHNRKEVIWKNKKLICVLCGQEWGVKCQFTNVCENENCKGFCTWGYELNKPESFTINDDGKWNLNYPE